MLFQRSNEDCTSKIRDFFQKYRLLLEFVNIKFYRWQVIWSWEYLVNIPITTDTYEHIYILINLQIQRGLDWTSV